MKNICLNYHNLGFYPQVCINKVHPHIFKNHIEVINNYIKKNPGITIDITFTPSSPVAKKTREKVKKIADKIGYRPNAMARSLITQKSNMVGIVISNVTINPFYPEVLDLLSTKIQEYGRR